MSDQGESKSRPGEHVLRAARLLYIVPALAAALTYLVVLLLPPTLAGIIACVAALAGGSSFVAALVCEVVAAIRKCVNNGIIGFTFGFAGLAVLCLLVGITFPSLNRARVYELRLNCKQNLERIGQALQAYRAGNHDLLPPSLGDLVTAGYLKEADLHCPDPSAGPGRNYDYFPTARPTTQDVSPASTQSNSGLRILVCDHPGNHGPSEQDQTGKSVTVFDGNVLFEDGSVTWQELPSPYDSESARAND